MEYKMQYEIEPRSVNQITVATTKPQLSRAQFDEGEKDIVYGVRAKENKVTVIVYPPVAVETMVSLLEGIVAYNRESLQHGEDTYTVMTNRAASGVTCSYLTVDIIEK